MNIIIIIILLLDGLRLTKKEVSRQVQVWVGSYRMTHTILTIAWSVTENGRFGSSWIKSISLVPRRLIPLVGFEFIFLVWRQIWTVRERRRARGRGLVPRGSHLIQVHHFFYEERAEFKIVLFSKFENILIFDPISTLLILTRTVWTEIRAANCSTLKIYFSKSVLFFVSDLEFIFLYFCFLYFNIVETE
jgi:hypothetical protein